MGKNGESSKVLNKSESEGLPPHEVSQASPTHKIFTKAELKKYKEVQTWLKTVSPKTRVGYLSTLKKFCKWSGKTPHQLIIERDREKNNPDPNERVGTKNLILDFRKYLETEGYAPTSINSMDGAIRGFFSAILGRGGMINVGNYPLRYVTLKKDLVPTLEELKKMLDVSDISTKFSIIFFAQTGMRPADALKLKVGNIQRELNLKRSPLAIRFLPQKDQNKGIGERITFLGADGVEILRNYLKAREMAGEEIIPDSPLFLSRSGGTISKEKLNRRIVEAAKKAGISNGNGKYGRMRTYCLRKFFITQMTTHGLEDKIINFFTSHKISSVDLTYWVRRVEELREIYRQREKFLNPISSASSKPPAEEIEELIEKKLKEFLISDKFKNTCSEIFHGFQNNNHERYESKIVSNEEEIIELSNKGYNCQVIEEGKWLMIKMINETSIGNIDLKALNKQGRGEY